MRRRRFKRSTSLTLLPLSPGRADVMALSTSGTVPSRCIAALNTQTGEMSGRPSPTPVPPSWSSSRDVVATQPRRREIHVIADNLSTHKTKDVQAFLTDHPSVHLHFTPTYSSWLNQVEIWFAKIERDLLARGIFTSVPDLARKIRRYIARYNTAPNRSVGPTAIRRIALLLASAGTGH